MDSEQQIGEEKQKAEYAAVRDNIQVEKGTEYQKIMSKEELTEADRQRKEQLAEERRVKMEERSKKIAEAKKIDDARNVRFKDETYVGRLAQLFKDLKAGKHGGTAEEYDDISNLLDHQLTRNEGAQVISLDKVQALAKFIKYTKPEPQADTYDGEVQLNTPTIKNKKINLEGGAPRQAA